MQQIGPAGPSAPWPHLSRQADAALPHSPSLAPAVTEAPQGSGPVPVQDGNPSLARGRRRLATRHRNVRAEPETPPPVDPQGAGVLTSLAPQQDAQPSNSRHHRRRGWRGKASSRGSADRGGAQEGEEGRVSSTAAEPGTKQRSNSAGDDGLAGHAAIPGSHAAIPAGHAAIPGGSHAAIPGSHPGGSEAGQPMLSYRVHDLPRPRKGRAAELARAAGDSGTYILR